MKNKERCRVWSENLRRMDFWTLIEYFVYTFSSTGGCRSAPVSLSADVSIGGWVPVVCEGGRRRTQHLVSPRAGVTMSAIATYRQCHLTGSPAGEVSPSRAPNHVINPCQARDWLGRAPGHGHLRPGQARFPHGAWRVSTVRAKRHSSTDSSTVKESSGCSA